MTPIRAFDQARRERYSVCRKCGALIVKRKKHAKWHAKNKPIPGPPGPMGPKGDSA